MTNGEFKKMGGEALTAAIGKMNAETSARLENLVETVTLTSVTHENLAEQERVVYCEDPELSMSVGGDKYKAIKIKSDEEETATGDYIDQLVACMTTFFVVKGPCPERKKGEEHAKYKTMQEMWGQAVKTQDERRRLYWEVDPNDVEEVIVE